MTNAFDAARDVLFTNDDGATDAIYFGVGAVDGLELRVFLDVAEPNDALFQTEALVAGNNLAVRKSELPERPLEGAQFVVGAHTLIVRTARVGDLDLWWICDVDEVAGG